MANQPRLGNTGNEAPLDRLKALLAALSEALAAVEASQPVSIPPIAWRELMHPLDGKPKRARADSVYLTLEEFCAELGTARSTFYDWRAKGKAPRCVTLPNGSLRIRRSEFERWLAEREDAA